jgi:hypothetical protein
VSGAPITRRHYRPLRYHEYDITVEERKRKPSVPNHLAFQNAQWSGLTVADMTYRAEEFHNAPRTQLHLQNPHTGFPTDDNVCAQLKALAQSSCDSHKPKAVCDTSQARDTVPRSKRSARTTLEVPPGSCFLESYAQICILYCIS